MGSTIGFVGKLFGRDKTAAPPSDRHSPPVVAVVPVPPPVALVHRDEILDDRTRISGYRFRPVAVDGAVPPLLQEKVKALKADNLAHFAQRRLAVVPLKVQEWQDEDFRQFVTPNTIFQIEVPPPGGDVAAWQQGLAAMRASGARIGLDSVAVSSRLAEAIKLADAIFIKPADYPVDAFDRLVGHLRSRHPKLTIVADGVYTWPEYRACLGMGAHYCLGSFATMADVEEKTDALPQSRLILIEMLNLLRGDAELTELASLAKRDPGVAIKVLEMANSPLAGCTRAVASIDQAIMMLGREALYRWMVVAVFRAGAGDGRDEALLEIALRRARLLELCAYGRLGKKEADELFVLGLMSLMDKLLALPMARVLDKMPLPDRIKETLSECRGPYMNYLRLALAIEKGAAGVVARLSPELGLDAGKVVELASAARAWAERSVVTT